MWESTHQGIVSCQPEGIDDVLERPFDRDDARDHAVHGVGADDDVARRVGEGIEDLPDHVLGVVRGRVGLDTGAHVSLSPPSWCPAAR